MLSIKQDVITSYSIHYTKLYDGEPEETMAWDYLGRTRALLAKYDISKVRKADQAVIEQAQDYMYLAEGSDWFWWYSYNFV